MIGNKLLPLAEFLVKQVSKSWTLKGVVDKYSTTNVFCNTELFDRFANESSCDKLDYYYTAIKRKLTMTLNGDMAQNAQETYQKQ